MVLCLAIGAVTTMTLLRTIEVSVAPLLVAGGRRCWCIED